MSLVNLAHVCSHLQNASLARLGLTSIPYSKLHLRLALLLQQQGFFSQVKLAGPSPPPSAFAGGENSQRKYLRPGFYRDEEWRGSVEAGETALRKMVVRGLDEQELRNRDFAESEVAFAAERRLKKKKQLEQEPWADAAINFITAHTDKSKEDLEAAGLDEQGVAVIEQHRHLVEDCRAEVVARYNEAKMSDRYVVPAHEDQEAAAFIARYLPRALRARLLSQDFDAETLRYFAGDNQYLSLRELEEDGIDLDVMGLTVENQPFKPPGEQYDPWDMEAEGVVTQANRASRRLWLGLKYWDNMPVLSKARMVSKPTKRITLSDRELGKVVRGSQAGEVKALTKLGECMVVSTRRGLMDARECVERRLGGLVLCRVW